MRHGTKTTKLTFGALAMAAASLFAIGSTSSDARAADKCAAQICGANYGIDIAHGSCAAGAECTVTLKLTAFGDGFHVNKDFNHKFTADGGGVTFLGKDDSGANVFSKKAGDVSLGGDGKSSSLTIRFKPTAKGKVTISGSYRLAVCTDSACSPTTQAVPAVTINVK
jgi:hypothetical protein